MCVSMRKGVSVGSMRNTLFLDKSLEIHYKKCCFFIRFKSEQMGYNLVSKPFSRCRTTISRNFYLAKFVFEGGQFFRQGAIFMGGVPLKTPL